MDIAGWIAGRIVHPLMMHRPGVGIGRRNAALERSQWLAPDQIHEAQQRDFQDVLLHAWDTIPLYRERFAEAGLDRADLEAGVAASAVPPLAKRDLQTRGADLMSSSADTDAVFWDRTGGSTGEPVKFCYDRARAHDRRALTMRHDVWAGWHPGARIVQLWGHPRDISLLQGARHSVRRTILDRRVTFDVGDVDDKRLEAFHRQMLDWKPEVLVGYANALYLYSRFVETSGADRFPTPRGIVSSAEMLEPRRRETIESVFGCRVFDRYGARETSLIASECEAHDGLHVAAESLLVEIDAHTPGQPGPVVVTDLRNRAMPLIRYRIGDVARVVDGTCACGRGLPRIEVIGGRVTEFLVRADDSLVSGAALTINLLARFDAIAQGRFRQERDRSLVMRVVPGPGWGPAVRSELMGEIRAALGEGIEIRVHEVNSIPLASSGKHQFSESDAITDDLRVLPR